MQTFRVWKALTSREGGFVNISKNVKHDRSEGANHFSVTLQTPACVRCVSSTTFVGHRSVSPHREVRGSTAIVTSMTSYWRWRRRVFAEWRNLPRFLPCVVRHKTRFISTSSGFCRSLERKNKKKQRFFVPSQSSTSSPLL